MKAVLKILPLLLITVYLITAFGFTTDERKSIICTEVNVIIRDSLTSMFYTKGDIREMIQDSRTGIQGYPVSEINTRKLEELFLGKPYISKVDIYTTMKGILTVKIKQREPVIRVFTNESRSYYLDNEGYIMPESRNFTPFVIVANGYFPGGDEINTAGNLHNIKNKQRYRPWFDALELVKKINEDDFWRSQFVQIYLNRKGKFELIPRVGGHLIILGEISDLDEKFYKLKTLYLKGLPVEGWNNYEKIDLRYKHQVVCTKR